VYAYPVLFPQVSNREDWLQTVAVFDDDLGTAVLMDGTAVPGGQAFTASAWTVTDGAIVTTSATQITIPVYPIGNQLSALALTVGLNLAILPGDLVTIADTVTGKNTMRGYVTSYVPATGALVVQIGYTFDFEIRRRAARYDGSGYIPWYDFGVPDEYGPLISASLGNGILITDVGVLQILIPVSTFQRLRGGTYSAAMICSDGVNTRQLFVGQLPVQWGGVMKQPASAAASSYNPNIF
jgi:hypothetical protein